MANNNKILDNGSFVAVRLDGAFIRNTAYLTHPFEREDGSKTYFGSFQFSDGQELYAKETLEKAVNLLVEKGATDTIFDGKYPKWIADDYGEKLKVSNRVHFFKELNGEEIAEADVPKHNYALEVHLSVTKNNEIFLKVSRAISIKDNTPKYCDGIFDDATPVDKNPDDINLEDII